MSDMSSVSSNNLENIYHNSLYGKTLLGYGSDMFSNMIDGDHIEFKDSVSAFEYFFFYGPEELLYQVDLCIMI